MMAAAHPLFVLAHAKVNFSLDVLGKRADGYHELASIMQTVALHDTLRLTPTRDGAITCVTDQQALNTPLNLAMRAAYLLQSTVEDDALGVDIELRKNVPVQAGLGGGSSDAAAVLTALNRLWRLHYPVARLEQLGAELGSDVPFFVRGGSALVEGRGERVSPLPDAEALWLLLVKPAVDVPTGEVFRRLAPDQYTSGAHSHALAAAIRRERSLPFEHFYNALEPAVAAAYPAVEAAREAVRAAGAPAAYLSGSGPTLFSPFRSLLEARDVFLRVRAADLTAWLTHTVTRATATDSNYTT
jgi:4-diphosphocytidyl-2-C-methyl-D-erythritol kinase